MRFYQKEHKYYCGIDLHARAMYVCIINQRGKVVYHKNVDTDPAILFRIIFPYLEDVVVCVECMFCWYWLADFCRDHHIPFVLAHALYLKAIHGGKTKNDKIDSRKIAMLLRGGNIPMAYAYPKERRAIRDLLRRRMHLMHKRAELLSHIVNTKPSIICRLFPRNLPTKRIASASPSVSRTRTYAKASNSTWPSSKPMIRNSWQWNATSKIMPGFTILPPFTESKRSRASVKSYPYSCSTKLTISNVSQKYRTLPPMPA